VEVLKKNSKDASKVPSELKSCKRDNQQYFCNKNKLILADIHRDLVKEYSRLRKFDKRYNPPVNVVLANIIFKNEPYEAIYI